MKDDQSFGVHFMIRRDKAQDNVAPIYAKISVDGDSALLSTKYWVPIAAWENKKGLAKSGIPELTQLNTDLELERSAITNCYKTLREAGELLSPHLVKATYLKGSKQANGSVAPRLTLRTLMQKYEEVEGKRLKKGTWKNYTSTFAYLDGFLKKEIPGGDIRVDKLTKEFLTSFKTYIPKNPIKEGFVCQGNGLAKHIERTMRMVNWAVDEELLDRPPVGSYKVKKKKPKKIFLDEEELARMEAQVFLDEEVAYVHDLAIFACYTGLAYCDVMNVIDQDISILFGATWLSNERIKSEGYFKVPLLKKPLSILNKYRYARDRGKRKEIFPYISNQQVNRAIKVILQISRIHKKITFHKMRHTFGTTVTLANNMPIESLMKMMGHSKISSTLEYAQVVDSKLMKDMQGLSERLEKPVHIRRPVFDGSIRNLMYQACSCVN